MSDFTFQITDFVFQGIGDFVFQAFTDVTPATGGGASGAKRYRAPAWWGDEQKRKLQKKIEAVQKQIEKKRAQVDFAPDLYRMERLIEQIAELQRRLMKLLEQIDEINKQAGEEEVALIYAIWRSLH